jgi:hypothetical protein
MDTEALRVELAQLRQEHRDLDVAVEALAATRPITTLFNFSA